MTLIWIILLQTVLAVPCLPENSSPVDYNNLSAKNFVALAQVEPDSSCPKERTVQESELTKILGVPLNLDSKDVAIAKLVQKSQKNEVRQISLVFNGVLFFAVVGLIVRQQKMKSIYLGGSGQSTDSGPAATVTKS